MKSSWLVSSKHAGAGSPRGRIVCFPFAGGASSVFRAWSEPLRAWSEGAIEVVSVQLPGREARFNEPRMTSLADLADAVAQAMTTLGREPFAFLGHSMGAHLAFEVARRLRARGEPMPTRLFVSGARAPHLPRRERSWHDLSDDGLIAELHKLGGTPPEVLRDRELLALILPTFRADLTALETHRHEEQPPLDLALSAFGGLDDHAVSRSDLDAWSLHSTRAMTTTMFPGAHFFIESARAAVLTHLYGVLSQSLLARSLGVQTRAEGIP